MEVRCYMPVKAQRILQRKARYKVLYGGRGSGKSYAIANALIVLSIQSKIRVLCTREFQSSIRDSVHRLLADRISALGLPPFFTIMKDTIISKTGSEFIFRGIRSNVTEIKSLEGIDYVWCEESEKISKDSWNVLTPTIRREGSEIWISFNPEDMEGETYQRFIINPPDDCISDILTFEDNDLFPSVLRREMEYCRRTDPDKFGHVWMGKPKKFSDALIFKGKYTVEDFETPEGVKFFHGCDFGFADDPSAAVRCFIKDMRLYIDFEAYGYGVEITELPKLFGQIPTARKWEMIADSSRPDTISYLKQNGFPQIIGAVKGKDSVEEGIEFIKSFERIIIHPRCKHTAEEFGSYRFKQDKVTGEIMPIPLDKSNHALDSLRYSLEKYMKRKVTIFDIHQAQQDRARQAANQ